MPDEPGLGVSSIPRFSIVTRSARSRCRCEVSAPTYNITEFNSRRSPVFARRGMSRRRNRWPAWQACGCCSTAAMRSTRRSRRRPCWASCSRIRRALGGDAFALVYTARDGERSCAERERTRAGSRHARRLSRAGLGRRPAAKPARLDGARLRRWLGADAGCAWPPHAARRAATRDRLCGRRISGRARRCAELEAKRSSAASRSRSGAHAADRRPCAAGGRGRSSNPTSRDTLRADRRRRARRVLRRRDRRAPRRVRRAQMGGLLDRRDLAAYRAEWSGADRRRLPRLPRARMPAQRPGAGGADGARGRRADRLVSLPRAILRNAGTC